MIRADLGGVATLTVDGGDVDITADSPRLEEVLHKVAEIAAGTMNTSPSVYDHDLELAEEIARVSGLELTVTARTEPEGHVEGRVY